ncbi:MAG TPA: hypothetical protein VJM51_04080, partial [Dehalococcoidia bacterium]|nr:hypothetical protein [Dehalococcoidia bacterium]
AGREINRLIAVLWGVFLLVLVTSIPVLDVIIAILVLLSGVGVLGWAVYDGLKPRSQPVLEGTPEHP